MNQLQYGANQFPNDSGQLQTLRAPGGNYSPERNDLSVGDMFAAIRRRKWMILGIVLTCLALAVLASLIMRKTWRAEAQMVMVEHIMTSQDTTSLPVIETVDTQLAMMQSDAMADRTIQWLKEDALAKGQSTDTIDQWFDIGTGDSYAGFAKMVTVTDTKGTNVLDVTVDAHDRQEAAMIANAVTQAFVQWKKDLAQRDLSNAEETLAFRVPRARAQLQAAEQRELAFKQAHHLVDVPGQQALLVQELHDHDVDIAAQTQQIKALDSRVSALKSRVDISNSAIAHGTGVRDDNLVLSLQTQLTQLQIDRANLATRYTSAYPGVLSVQDAKIADVQKRLDAAIAGTTDDSRPSLTSQGAFLDMYRQALVQQTAGHAQLAEAIHLRNQLAQSAAAMPEIAVQFARLDRDTQLALTLYETLQANLNAARLDKDKVAGNIQITEPAIVPKLPYKPNWLMNLAIGTALGLFLSIILTILLDELDRSVQNIDDVRRLVPAPVVGLLPQLKSRQMRALGQGKQLPELSEAMNFTRVHLTQAMRHSLGSDRWQHQIILVTSAIAGEGKSMAAAELAKTMAQSGKSVILMDANLRRSASNAQSRSSESQGLAEVMSGNLSLEEAIVTTDVAGLSVLHSGTAQENPSHLFAQPRFATLMEALRYKAEVIIVDTPDCSSFADTLLLAPYADCIVQVVRMGYADKELVQSTALALKATGKPLTVTVNSMSRDQQKAYRNSYDYAIWNGRNGTYNPAKPTEKTMVLTRSRDLIFAQSPHTADGEHGQSQNSPTAN